MPYTWGSRTRRSYKIDSWIEEQKYCDSCNTQKRVMCLPAESNAGELFTANLCVECMRELIKEFDLSSTKSET